MQNAGKEFKLENKLHSYLAHAAGWMTTVLGGITLEKFAVIVGIGTSLGTFAVNWHYARKKAQRDAEG